MNTLRAQLRGLYVITDERLSDHMSVARAALLGGASIIQLRDKSTPLRLLLPQARALRRLTREMDALFIINDRPDLALAVEADGIHLGPDDLPPAAARQVLGKERLIGVSCGDLREVRLAAEAGADYIGVGAVFGTLTKADAGPAIGLRQLRAIIKATTLPVAAIGGINLGNIGGVWQTGAAMACVVSAVAAAGDETAMMEATRALIASQRLSL